MIPIQNLYYMLSYTFQILNEQGYKKLSTEKFQNAPDMCAAILIRGITYLVKRGLGRAYISTTEETSSVKGKIDISQSIKSCSMLEQRMVCTFDEFSVDSPLNRIIKTTSMLLLKSDIAPHRKKELRKLMVYFEDVSIVDIHTINWSINYNRNNVTYRLLITICYLVIKGLLQSNKDGYLKMMDFLDEQKMHRIYERFILEYFKKHYKNILNVSSSKINWALDDDMSIMLPDMQSDIMLSCKSDNREKVLIIDAKYYTHTTQSRFEKKTLHSNNLYQIFTYVKNKSVEGSQVSGMLLYAKTEDDAFENYEYRMSGNLITVRTLDLNCPSDEIDKQLNFIADTFIRA